MRKRSIGILYRYMVAGIWIREFLIRELVFSLVGKTLPDHAVKVQGLNASSRQIVFQKLATHDVDHIPHHTKTKINKNLFISVTYRLVIARYAVILDLKCHNIICIVQVYIVNTLLSDSVDFITNGHDCTMKRSFIKRRQDVSVRGCKKIVQIIFNLPWVMGLQTVNSFLIQRKTELH